MHDELEIVRDLLDKQIVDCEETKMGRADGLVLEVERGKQPRIDHIELGFTVLARRLGPRIERWFTALRKRWSVRRTARQIVPWSSVDDITSYEIKLDVKAIDTPAFDWERWLRDHVIAKIPGAGGS